MPTPMTPIDDHHPTMAAPEPLSGLDRLGLISASPGPYTTVLLQTRPLARNGDDNTARRWAELRAQLIERGAPTVALDAIDARLTLPAPDGTAAVGVIAAADGHTVVDWALEPPRRDFAVVDSLPYAAPFIEWDQRRVPHLVVVADDSGVDIVEFRADHRTTVDAVDGSVDEALVEIRRRVQSIDCRLVVVSGAKHVASSVADGLVPLVAPRCNVVLEHDDSPDELAETTVRHVEDSVASETVGLLREYRFLAEHDAAVDGAADVIDALRAARRGVLLIHDDPTDARRVWVGPNPTDLSITAVPGWTATARFVDAAIFAAIAGGIAVRVIPSTGERGPDDGAAVLWREGPTLEVV